MASENIASHERNAGLLLIAAAGLALVLANTPVGETYHAILHAKLGPLTVHYWIADALMAVFFLLVGLEVKREWFDGQLATASARRLPMVAAVGGMAVPALVYLLIAGSDAALTNGWAIPAATDIAFALGVLALIGSRAPASIKLLLVTIAIIDDIGAVAIIAVFYTAELDLVALLASALILGAMFGLNRAGVCKLWPYLVGFVLLWLAVYQSGVHATIAGVLAALTVPLGQGQAHSPLKKLEHKIHPLVMFGVVPLFGFASAGVTIGSGNSLFSTLPLAIASGLFLGKQLGVLGAVWLAHRTGFARKPAELGWWHMYAAALLCGIGFTMSLFIGDLAFDDSALVDAAKIGTLAGSVLAIAAAIIVLRLAPARVSAVSDQDEADEIFGENFPEEPQLDQT
ncbi:Na+/H+ antiporter NhaA [Altererythrobacter soli]|uniref:Na(+)/H(+) antiporter NhaA n=1 Tax=Croceibacterium soli TaxID=1739690 RepID=A0A6I4UY92_9SPHN|nr:Na+/H+ antiporter NhaA [Croceibacterium soli]